MPKRKLSIISILMGTIVYFIVFGLSLYGDEYINLGVRHVNTFLWLLIAISGSLLLRVKPEQFRQVFLLYSATFIVMLTIISCRITFVPDKRVDAMRNRITYVSGEDRESLLFGATWLYDFIRQVAVPTIVLLSLPLCARLSLGMFDFDDLFVKFYENPFVQLYDQSGFETLRISAKSIIWLLIFFYVLRYFSKAIHAIWQYARYATFMRKHNRTTIRANEINLSLGNSITIAFPQCDVHLIQEG